MTYASCRDELFSMADIVTPNVKEASKLLGGVSLQTVSDMRSAAESIYKFGPKYASHSPIKYFCC
jgi:hydroxymethylpyrimidine kinase / phosphomethylpyrimidine kinase / thiamine-phosphate diphosphorylase